MKKLITLITATTIMFSCQKEQVTKSPVVKKETVASAQTSTSITNVNIIPNNIVSSTASGGVETFTYSDGSIAKISGIGKINITMTRGGKTDLITATDITFGGIRTVKLYTKGNLYHSFQVNSSGYLNNIFIDSRYYPYPNIYPTGNDPYLRCMQEYISKCAGWLKCALMFGTSQLGMIGAGIGWSAACILGIKP